MHVHLLNSLRKITRQLYTTNIQLLATELFKAKNGLSPPFMNKIFVENAQHYHDLRKKAEFKRNVNRNNTTEPKL